MAITTGDGYIAAAKQIVPFTKTASVTAIALNRFGVFATNGSPGAGTLAGTSTAAGVVPTDATNGTPTLRAFGGGATGYLSRVQFASSIVGRLELWDCLFKAGAYATTPTGTTTLSAQPSFSSRIPGGTDYTGLRIFLEISTQIAASAVTVNVTYTNADGTAGRSSTATASLSGFTVNRLIEMPLAAGDNGVQKIESVIIGGTAAATGNFNVLILRPLWTGRVPVVGGGDVHGLDKTGMPQVWADSALMLTVVPDSTATGIPDLNIEIANG